MRIGEVIRYPRKPTLSPVVDGLPNWYYLTSPPADFKWAFPKIDSGINTSAIADSVRIPYLGLRSSPHRFGSVAAPWEDVHRPDQGYSRFFGDAKPGGKPASEWLGNRRMLEAFVQQGGSREQRADSPPVLIFEAVGEDGRLKGQVLFHGIAVITKAELIVQREEKGKRRTFPNFAFELAHLDLARENDTLDWGWINARRDPSVTTSEALQLAPSSWSRWVETGSIGPLRRSVVTRGVVTETMQRPKADSEEYQVLHSIYLHYQGRQHRFEALAEFVIEQIFREQGIEYRRGWITQGSGDGGYDFVGAVDLDPAGILRSSRQVLLGQAKCEKLDRSTSGLHIARLAARLRRGWLGAYVTTSWFSMPVQREILADRYPVILVDGLRLSQVVRKYLIDNGLTTNDFLELVDSDYETRIGFGDPEAILAM